MTERDKLIQLIQDSNCVDYWNYYTDDFKEPDPVQTLADYILEDGWVRPPCRLHQTMWGISWNNRIDECKVSGLTQKVDGSWKIRLTNLHYKGVFEITVDDIGKSVFWTKEEAEKEINK